MGVLSYSLYLIHYVVIQALKVATPELGMLGIGVASLAISLALSYAIYVLAEVPAAKLKKKFVTH